MFAVRPPQTTLRTRGRGVGKPTVQTAPVTFSIGCLDIRHRLPDPKGRETTRLAVCACTVGISTPQSGAYPPRSKNTFVRMVFAVGSRN